jgi:hypothetical protein
MEKGCIKGAPTDARAHSFRWALRREHDLKKVAHFLNEIMRENKELETMRASLKR